MILARDVLESKKVPELRMLLMDMGATFSEKETKTELIDRYEELSAAVQPNEEPTEAKPEPVAGAKEDPWLKKAEVLEVCKRYLQAGLVVEFEPDGKVWTMSIRRGNVTLSDCGSMKQPLTRIQRCAEMLCRPAYAAAEKGGGFGGGTPLAEVI